MCKLELVNVNFLQHLQTVSSKVHIYKTICRQTLIYGIDSLDSNNKCIKQLVTQECIIYVA